MSADILSLTQIIQMEFLGRLIVSALAIIVTSYIFSKFNLGVHIDGFTTAFSSESTAATKIAVKAPSICTPRLNLLKI